MKFLLMLFLLTPFAPLVYAEGLKEPVYPPYCWAQPAHSDLWYPCGSEEAFNANCVQRMDFAMHKVDPYLGKEVPEAILKSWDRVKHDCWKEYAEERSTHLH
jgi:hypothetical protein